MFSRPTGPVIRVVPAVALLALSGCVSVPESVSLRTESDLQREVPVQVSRCAAGPDSLEPAGSSRDSLGDQFTMINWNVLKGRRGGWAADLVTHRGEGDLIILQEAYLTDELRDLLDQDNYNWKLATAFQVREIEAGVMTASRVRPATVCAQRSPEPILKLPKSMLITEYRIGDGSRTLLVANIHAINFSLGTTAFTEQMRSMRERVMDHDGPVVISGDFNTWSSARQQALDAAFGEASLYRIAFDRDKLKKVFGKPLDHIYYRDLDLVEFEAIPVASSDHNPMRVTFRYRPDV